MVKNKIKVLIFSGYGVDAVTQKMAKIMDKYQYPKNRVGEVCDFIEDTAKYFGEDISWEDICDFLEKNPNEIIRIEDNYYVHEPTMRMPCKIAIKEVNINRPWTIMEYDGAEYIKYLDFDIIDEEIHFCKYKKEEDK